VSYTVLIMPAARKALADLPKHDQIRVDQRIRSLADNPRPPGAIPFKGANRSLWRLRVGDYRVLYRIEDDRLVVIVIDIGNRRDVYRGL
jgi:mRNA interferase RelE/StbE